MIALTLVHKHVCKLLRRVVVFGNQQTRLLGLVLAGFACVTALMHSRVHDPHLLLSLVALLWHSLGNLDGSRGLELKPVFSQIRLIEQRTHAESVRNVRLRCLVSSSNLLAALPLGLFGLDDLKELVSNILVLDLALLKVVEVA